MALFRIVVVFCFLIQSVTGADKPLFTAPSSPDDVDGLKQPGSEEPAFSQFTLLKAPPIPASPVIKKGDRLAIIGDSITEQKMYSRIIETYLTVCVPEFEVSVRQLGWSGETAEGFLRRMESDCLRFEPTIATLCYGMNDHRYRTYDQKNGQWYLNNYYQVVKNLQVAGSRVILGTPGNVGKVPGWTNSNDYSLDQLNRNLATLRNIDVMMAASLEIPLADIFWNMLKASEQAKNDFGDDYAVPGKDGVHPNWSGQLIMAYSFLSAMGLDGHLASISIDLGSGNAKISKGHKIQSSDVGTITIISEKYPFCATGAKNRDDSIRSGMELVPFNEKLNRFTLKVEGTIPQAQYNVTWGDASKTYSGNALSIGINLAEDFESNPFSRPFQDVDQAVFQKQNYETRQIKNLFHGPEFRVDPDGVVEISEKTLQGYVRQIKSKFKPVEHTITVKPL